MKKHLYISFRNIALLALMFTLAIGIKAQVVVTPQARLAMAHNQDKAAHARADKSMKPQTVTLVVEVAPQHQAQTIAAIKAVGATVRSAVGRQAVISLPLDSVACLERISGLQRIDRGHRGRLKTDITRQATGVSELNGPTATDLSRAFSGKGVNLLLVDVGIDFTHRAFQDSLGRSRIKAVYMLTSDEGRKITVEDPDWGSYELPGSLYDTPELIATLTTDTDMETHGSHTLGIAAGSISPQGYGGMAPEADIIAIPLGFVDENEGDFEDADEAFETILAFARYYARQSPQPTVLSASLNSHEGKHDGTSTICRTIEEASADLIPVFSAGNEGGFPIHLYQKFDSSQSSVKTLLMGMVDETPDGRVQYEANVSGFTLAGDEVSVQLALKSVSMINGRMTTLWSSDMMTARKGAEMLVVEMSSDSIASLDKGFKGVVGLAAGDMGDGQLAVSVVFEGSIPTPNLSMNFFELTIGGSEGTEIHLWDDIAGFGGQQNIGLPGYVDGDSEISGGDWTSTDRVVSVGAYTANIIKRDVNGTQTDTSKGEDGYIQDDIAYFSSYGTSLNGIKQPLVCAPGTNIVSAYNSYVIADDVVEAMQWENSPYGPMDGTSMACPAVAGVIALWLQAAPTLSFDDVKDVLAHSSDNDANTAAAPERWGYGKINAAIGIDYIIGQGLGVRELNKLSGKTKTARVYDLSGRRITGQPAPGLYIIDGRKTSVR